mgnify:FL=1
MANSNTKNNVSGAPKANSSYGKGGGGSNTAGCVSAASGGGFGNGGYSQGLGGNQNGTNGGKSKFPTKEGSDVAVERTPAKAINGPMGTKGPKVS